MKKTMVSAATAALVITSGSAMAGAYDPSLDVVLDLGSFSLNSVPNGGVTTVTFDIREGPSDVVGFSFSGTVDGIGDSASWASDLQMVLFLEGDAIYSIGGFSGVENEWDFQGFGSNDDGTYTQAPTIIAGDAPVPGGLAWAIQFTNDWDSTAAATMEWSDVTFTIHRVPGPGALALLGLAGLATRRRR